MSTTNAATSDPHLYFFSLLLCQAFVNIEQQFHLFLTFLSFPKTNLHKITTITKLAATDTDFKLALSSLTNSDSAFSSSLPPWPVSCPSFSSTASKLLSSCSHGSEMAFPSSRYYNSTVATRLHCSPESDYVLELIDDGRH